MTLTAADQKRILEQENFSVLIIIITHPWSFGLWAAGPLVELP
jgi:hypothetical protein